MSDSSSDSTSDFGALTGTATGAFGAASALFAAQASLHWCRSGCGGCGAASASAAAGAGAALRTQQHELLSSAAAGLLALVYLGLTCGVSQDTYATYSGSDQRTWFPLQYAGRGGAAAALLLNVATLARERRPPMVSLAILWLGQVASLYMAHFVKDERPYFCAVALAFLLPMVTTLHGVMGRRLRLTALMPLYRFLASWCIMCGACYVVVFLCSAVLGLFSSETELLAYVLVDYALIGVSSLVISCAGPERDIGLLPAQEAELSLYPGPHDHGFYPNPNFYDDNL